MRPTWKPDLVFSQALVFLGQIAFISAVYLVLVVSVPAALGMGDRPNRMLSILATALVAIAFQPAGHRLRRIANGLVYGKRTNPYEVLSRFSEQVAGTYSADEVLPRMARLVAQGTGAAAVDIWLKVGADMVRAASWPDGSGEVKAGQQAVAVRDRGELLGAFTITPAGRPPTPADDRLLSDLASQAGLLLRNARLTTDLQARLQQLSVQTAEVRASRQRIVAAQDDERRRLEQNIHDGAQQHLVALSLRLGRTASMLRRDPERAPVLFRELEAETAQALETLSELAAGMYPSLLRERGLGAAIETQAARMPIPVRVTSSGLSRFDPDAEAAVYFCCLEALQNVAKHAAASRAEVLLKQVGDELIFTVADDGIGLKPGGPVPGSGLQNMRDRVEGLGGRLDMRSTPGGGTTVAGRLPTRSPVAV